MPVITRQTRVISLRRPWGRALVKGFKKIENRRRRLRGAPCWVLVLSSKAVPTRADMTSLRKSLAEDGRGEEYRQLGHGSSSWGEPQAILGWIKISDCVNDSTSPWAIPGCSHWKVEQAIEFEQPLRGPGGAPIEGCQSMVRYVSSLPQSVADHLISTQPE